MKKQIIVLCSIAFILSSFLVLSEDHEGRIFDEDKAYSWLVNKLEQNNWGNNIETISWSIMALNNAGYNYSLGVSKLKSFESGYNWENNIYKTALATMALQHVGENVSNEIQWLLERQSVNLGGGDWLVQFNPDASQVESTCIVDYGSSESAYIVSGLNITPMDSSCSLVNELWVSFENCIKEGSAGIYESFDVTCSPPLGSSLIYKVGDSNYHIIDESTPNLEIENGCFNGQSNTCDCTYSQYAAWSVKSSGNFTHVLPFLRGNCNGNSLDNAFLYLLTSESSYKNWLESNQGLDGHWENDVRSTALSAYALKGSSYSSFNNALGWLGFMQNQNDGSWEQDEQLTATVLFAMTEEGGVIIPDPDFTECNNAVLEVGEECDINYECNSGETCINCQCISENETIVVDPEDCPLTGIVCSEDCPLSGQFYSGVPCQKGIYNEETCICESDISCVYDSECSSQGIGYTCNSAGSCIPPESLSECSYNSDCLNLGEICSAGVCILDEEIIISGECDYNYDCLDGEICSSGDCIPESEDGSNVLTWIIAILFVILALGGGYYAYMKYFKKGGPAQSKNQLIGPSKPAYSLTSQKVPISRPSLNVSRSETKIEKELDEALNKAKRLIKK
jgi:hypothetical protein